MAMKGGSKMYRNGQKARILIISIYLALAFHCLVYILG